MRRRRWRWCNRWAGVAIFGIPMAAGIGAGVGTVSRFGIAAVEAAGPPLLIVALPGLLWISYLRPGSRGSNAFTGWSAALIVALVVSLVVLATTPIGVWSVPGAAVLLSELTRLVVVAISGQTPRIDQTDRRSTGARRARSISVRPRGEFRRPTTHGGSALSSGELTVGGRSRCSGEGADS